MKGKIKGFMLAAVLAPMLAWAAPVDVNTADAVALEQVKGIGPKKAEAIVKYRQEHGPFQSLDDLVKVPGIGDKSLEGLRDQLTVSKPAAPAAPAAPAGKAK
ncbi:MAG: helix-hairpin-helix domain-containing protein [Halothiobacillaceae bacterium]|nr:helix-hairpin-helix domain-containing protein [Halothiobacillaceae bacterium]